MKYNKPNAEYMPLEAYSEYLELTSFEGLGLDDAQEEELIF